MNEDWSLLKSFLPANWAELALANDALKGLRKDKGVDNYLRTLLLHIGCGYSMRETVTRARMADLAAISDVGLLGRIKKSKDWLQSMCVELLAEQGVDLGVENSFSVRLFDATNIKEPGQTGSLWRIHYSVELPSLTCDYFKLTAAKGEGTGESFFQYSIKKGDYIIADRGYCTASGIHHVASKKAFVMVRVNPQNLPILDLKGNQFHLLDEVTAITRPGEVSLWQVLIPSRRSTESVKGRICVLRKSEEAIKLAHQKLKRVAQKSGYKTKPETLEYAKYVIVFTTYPEVSFTGVEVLDWYRIRWQVELVFKRFKSIAQIGHLPKYDDESSKAWLYGKLLVALLTQKLIKHASSISPWGYVLEEHATLQ